MIVMTVVVRNFGERTGLLLLLGVRTVNDHVPAAVQLEHGLSPRFGEGLGELRCVLGAHALEVGVSGLDSSFSQA